MARYSGRVAASCQALAMTPFLLAFTGTCLRRWIFLLTLVGALGGLASAADAPVRREWKVDGVTRTGLVYTPATAKSQPTPVVFAFHGPFCNSSSCF